MPVGINYEFLIAAAGAVSNPQYEIVGARVSYTLANVYYPCWAQRCTTATAAATTPLLLQTTAVFVDTTSGTLSEGVLPPPSVLPALPADIFYPFYLGSSSASVAAPHIAVVAATTAGALLVLLASMLL